MSPYRFELAGPEDDEELRAMMAETPMRGAISVVFRREPSFFSAAVVEGRFRQVLVAREEQKRQTRRIVAVGSRSVGMRYVNGRPTAIGYLSGLRILPGHRGGGLLARGYAALRKLHADGRTPLYLTTIAEDNRAALAALTGGRAGLPVYHFAGRYHTAAIRLGARRASRGSREELPIRPARAEDMPAVLEFLRRTGPKRQFFPCYEPDDFGSECGGLRGLEPGDLCLAFRDGRLIGTLGGWDQHAFRQVRVAGYQAVIRWTRPWYNAWARVRGLPRLPRPNRPLRYLVAALPLVADDDPAVFGQLLEALMRLKRGGPWEYLLVGMHESDPLLAALRRCPAAWYTTNLYLACWQDGDELRRSLDGRLFYLELGSL